MRPEIVLNISVCYHNLVASTHIGTFNRSPKGPPSHNPTTVFTHINTCAIYRAIHCLTFLPFCPCFVCGKRKRAQSPAAASVRPWNALRETTKEEAPIGGAFSTSPALAVKFSRFHLSLTMRRTHSLKLSIANYSKTSAICGHHSAKNAKGNCDPAPSSVEGHTLPLLHSFIPQPKSYAENQEKSVCVGPVLETAA